MPTPLCAARAPTCPSQVDKLLVADAAEDDRQWGAMLVEEEAAVKLEAAEMIWADLLQDTANVMAELDGRLAGRRAG